MGDVCQGVGRFHADGNSTNAVNGNKYPGDGPQGELARFFPFTWIPVQLLVGQHEDNGNQVDGRKNKTQLLMRDNGMNYKKWQDCPDEYAPRFFVYQQKKGNNNGDTNGEKTKPEDTVEIIPPGFSTII